MNSRLRYQRAYEEMVEGEAERRKEGELTQKLAFFSIVDIRVDCGQAGNSAPGWPVPIWEHSRFCTQQKGVPPSRVRSIRINDLRRLIRRSMRINNLGVLRSEAADSKDFAGIHSPSVVPAPVRPVLGRTLTIL